MKTKTVWTIIIALVMLNCLTVAYFVTSEGESVEKASTLINSDQVDNEVVARIGDKQITRQEWLGELETHYGKQILEDMIDEQVIKHMAKKYNITISDEIIDREITMIKTMYNTFDNEKINDENWREQIELSILLEELLTKDVSISEEEMKKFYEENIDLYEIPKTFHLSHIVVKTEEEAEQVRKELENGSSFSVLAMEKSIDEFSASRGGELGFVSGQSEYVPPSYYEAAREMTENKWSEPLKVDEGYAVIMLHETIEEVSYSFDEVKDQIRRQIAIDQMKGSISVQPFWEEAGVTWFYDNN